MPNGDSHWVDGVPTWVKSIVFLIGVLGAPMTIAFFFMGQSAGYIPSIGSRNTLRIDTMIVNQEAIIREIKEDRREGAELVTKLTTAMRIVCKNAAKDPYQTSNCEMIR